MDVFQESDVRSCVSINLFFSPIRLHSLTGLLPNIWVAANCYGRLRPFRSKHGGPKVVRPGDLEAGPAEFHARKSWPNRPRRWLRQAGLRHGSTADYFPDGEMLRGGGDVRCF